MLISLISCTAKKKNAYDIITDAQTKIAELDSCDITMELNLKFGAQGLTVKLPVSIDIKANGITTDSPKARIYAEMSYMEIITLSFDLYYEDEYLYLSAMGSNAKFSTKDMTNASTDENSAINTEELQEEYNQILKEALAEVEVLENEDGSKTVSYVINENDINSLLNKILEKAAATEDGQEPEIKCSDVEITQTVNKDGYIVVSDIKCSISITADLGIAGEDLGMQTAETSFDMEISATLNNPGSQAEVSPMDGYESFEEGTPEDALPEDFINM